MPSKLPLRKASAKVMASTPDLQKSDAVQLILRAGTQLRTNRRSSDPDDESVHEIDAVHQRFPMQRGGLRFVQPEAETIYRKHRVGRAKARAKFTAIIFFIVMLCCVAVEFIAGEPGSVWAPVLSLRAAQLAGLLLAEHVAPKATSQRQLCIGLTLVYVVQLACIHVVAVVAKDVRNAGFGESFGHGLSSSPVLASFMYRIQGVWTVLSQLLAVSYISLSGVLLTPAVLAMLLLLAGIPIHALAASEAFDMVDYTLIASFCVLCLGVQYMEEIHTRRRFRTLLMVTLATRRRYQLLDDMLPTVVKQLLQAAQQESSSEQATEPSAATALDQSHSGQDGMPECLLLDQVSVIPFKSNVKEKLRRELSTAAPGSVPSGSSSQHSVVAQPATVTIPEQPAMSPTGRLLHTMASAAMGAATQLLETVTQEWHAGLGLQRRPSQAGATPSHFGAHSYVLPSSAAGSPQHASQSSTGSQKQAGLQPGRLSIVQPRMHDLGPGSQEGSGKPSYFSAHLEGRSSESTLAASSIIPPRLHTGPGAGWSTQPAASLDILSPMPTENAAHTQGAEATQTYWHAPTLGSRHSRMSELDTPGGNLQEAPSVAFRYPSATVMFCYIVGMQKLVQDSGGLELVQALNKLYQLFDSASEEHGVYKIMAVADMYLLVSGAPEVRPDHAVAAAKMALAMLRIAHRANIEVNGTRLAVKIGMNSGPIAAGVIGSRTRNWHIFGDTVNLASRMCSTSLEGRIQLSPEAEHALVAQLASGNTTAALSVRPRGLVDVKGKGKLPTFWLEPPDRQMWTPLARRSTLASPVATMGRRLSVVANKARASFFGGITGLAHSVDRTGRSNSMPHGADPDATREVSGPYWRGIAKLHAAVHTIGAAQTLQSTVIQHGAFGARQELSDVDSASLAMIEVEPVSTVSGKFFNRQRELQFALSEQRYMPRLLRWRIRLFAAVVAAPLVLYCSLAVRADELALRAPGIGFGLAGLALFGVARLLVWHPVAALKRAVRVPTRPGATPRRARVLLNWPAVSLIIATGVLLASRGEFWLRRQHLNSHPAYLSHFALVVLQLSVPEAAIVNGVFLAMYGILMMARSEPAQAAFAAFLEAASAAALSMIMTYQSAISRRNDFSTQHHAHEEMAKCEDLLLSMLPTRAHAAALMRGQSIVETLPCVCMLYSDIVGFTSLSATLEPATLIQMLDMLYRAFDAHLDSKSDLYKIETIGDAFIVIGGMREVASRGANANLGAPPLEALKAMAVLGMNMLDEIALTRSELGLQFSMRIGIHVGPVVGGIIGYKRPRYFVWGKHTLVGNAMESHGEPGQVLVSKPAATQLATAGFIFDQKRSVEVSQDTAVQAWLLRGYGRRAVIPTSGSMRTLGSSAMPASADSFNSPATQSLHTASLALAANAASAAASPGSTCEQPAAAASSEVANAVGLLSNESEDSAGFVEVLHENDVLGAVLPEASSECLADMSPSVSAESTITVAGMQIAAFPYVRPGQDSSPVPRLVRCISAEVGSDGHATPMRLRRSQTAGAGSAERLHHSPDVLHGDVGTVTTSTSVLQFAQALSRLHRSSGDISLPGQVG